MSSSRVAPVHRFTVFSVPSLGSIFVVVEVLLFKVGKRGYSLKPVNNLAFVILGSCLPASFYFHRRNKF